MKIVDKKIYEVCPDCGEIVCLNKLFTGSLHVCTTPEERAAYNNQIRRKYAVNKHRLEHAWPTK